MASTFPFFGLLDSDASTDWAAVLGVSTGGLEAAGFFVCTPDLEAEYVRALGPERVVEMLVSSGLFAEPVILNSCSATSTASVSESALAAFCRKKKNKVPAATAVSLALSNTEAHALLPVDELLGALVV